MKISELKSGQGKVDIEVTVKSKGDVRSFNKYGKDLRVCNLVVHDDTGEIKFSLWNNDIDKVNAGDKIKVSNGYVSEFNGEKQLTTGKFGSLEVVSGSSHSHSDKKADKSEKHDKKKKDEEVSDEDAF
ncbi:DNA-binding protein [Candidatus Pacearchaeota archaeon]|nr:DNA-binding protein [Candidatus Pacearchaeota archaeon]